MKATVTDKAKKIIENRHYQADSEALLNKEKALQDSEFKNIYLQYINKIIDNAKTGNTDNTETANLKKEYEKRLKELKIGSIEPLYSCKKCKDVGVTENGYCECLIDEVNKILKKESGFLELEEFDKANFNLFEDKKMMKTLYSKMQKWCLSDFDKTIILLSGNTGVGKTHLTKCMANELIKRHKLVLLTTSFSMHQDFMKSYSTRDLEEKQQLLSRYLNAEILFIDDLGTELRNPNITISYLYQVLNERRINKRPTVITTNLNLNDIYDYYDERIFSRIADKTTSICVYIEGKDIRLNLK